MDCYMKAAGYFGQLLRCQAQGRRKCGSARGKHSRRGLQECCGKPRVKGKVAHEGPRVLEKCERHEDIIQADSQHYKWCQEVNEVHEFPSVWCRIY